MLTLKTDIGTVGGGIAPVYTVTDITQSVRHVNVDDGIIRLLRKQESRGLGK